VIYIGIDDTDILGSPGTNQLARAIVRRLGRVARGALILRHQLFFDPRIPYTSQNGSASIQLPHGDELQGAELLATVRAVMREHYVEGSDPGLAVGADASPGMHAFAARAKSDVVTQSEACAVASASACHLEGLGGTSQGIIGALAAVALAASGEDGRVVHLDGWPWPDAFAGVQPVAAVRERGIAEIRTLSGLPFPVDRIDVGKHLRPNWRTGRVVLFVDGPSDDGIWRAKKLD
jgi:hypothetical protein